MEKHKYTNDVLKKGIRSFQKHVDTLRSKLESNTQTTTALEGQLKGYEVKLEETDKQIKEFGRLKTTAMTLATENGFLKSQMKRILGVHSTDSGYQRRSDGNNDYFGSGGGVC